MLPEKNIFGKTSYDIFYRHSDIRQNLLGFLKFQPASRILMINEGKTCLVDMLEKQEPQIGMLYELQINNMM